MANRLKGEYDFEVDDKTYTVRLGANELIDASGLGVDINDMASLSTISSIRALLWVGLRAAHPDLDLLAVGNLMTDMGIKRAGEVMNASLKAAFPDIMVDENPQVPSPSGGTGSGS